MSCFNSTSSYWSLPFCFELSWVSGQLMLWLLHVKFKRNLVVFLFDSAMWKANCRANLPRLVLAYLVPSQYSHFSWVATLRRDAADDFRAAWETSQPWLVGIPIPLKNDGVRQLGWFSIPNCFWKVILKKMFQSPPTRLYTIIPYNYGKSPFLMGKSSFLMCFPCSSHHPPVN